MEKKNLIIGGIHNYNYHQIRIWVESLDKVCDEETTHKVLIISNISKETQQILFNKGFELFPLPQTNLPIHVARFLGIYEYLKTTFNDYNYVVTTDVRDVYFQTNPFDYIKNVFKNNDLKLLVGSEALKYKDEPWGNSNLYETYGEYVYNIFKENEIYNVGVLGGYSEYIKDLAFNILINSINRRIPIVDQAVFNVTIQTQPYKDVTLFAQQYLGWALQAGTVADPTKMEYFTPRLLEKIPKFENGKFLTSNGKEFCIVHQYDRVPEWKDYLDKKFRGN